MNQLELLSPAGDFERLVMAVRYGADAVFLAGREYGMRAASANFDDDTLCRGIQYAHENGARVYVTCNTLPREDELKRLPEYLEFLQDAQADALIIADLGVMAMAKKYAPKVARHVSTQLGVINSATANMLFDLGADTVVLARETPLEDIRKIRANTPKELRLEAFVHGAMCVSFSGRCLLSNYLADRDANRGQCAQPCRWRYHLVEEKRPGEYMEITEDNGTFILNSNDMRMIEHLPELIDAGVGSFKIEGRMKSEYYIAQVVKTYRRLIDEIYASNAPLSAERLAYYDNELSKAENRPADDGFLSGDCDNTKHLYGINGSGVTHDYVAIVRNYDANRGLALIEVKNKFMIGDELEAFGPKLDNTIFVNRLMFNDEWKNIEVANKPTELLYLRLPFVVNRDDMIRKVHSEE